MSGANPLRGDAVLRLGTETLHLRPTFAALVAAEAELGSLFALIERASTGNLRLNELAGLLWHCLDPQTLSRETFNERLVAAGLAQATPVFRQVATAILGGAA